MSSIVFLLLSACFSSTLVKCQTFSDRPNNFSLEFLYFTQIETDSHVVISSYGVWSLLTGVSFVALGDTREQLEKALFLPKSFVNAHYGWNNLIRTALTSTSDITVASQNYMIIDESLTSRFTEFNASISHINIQNIDLDFKEAESAVIVANRIIRDSGKDMPLNTLNNILLSNDISSVVSGVILVNINTFKGVWRTKFVKKNIEDFFDYRGKKKIGQVNIMYQRAKLAYVNFTPIKARIIELPFGYDDKYSMLILLPNYNVRVTDVYMKLENFPIKTVLKILQSYPKVMGDVKLPRFKISTNIVVNQPLYKMGVFNLFDKDYAKFCDVESNGLFISKIVHNVNIEVNERGMYNSVRPSITRTQQFHVNRPFIYFIMEKTTETIMFSGIYSKPTIY